MAELQAFVQTVLSLKTASWIFWRNDMPKMTQDECKRFLAEGARTAKLGTTRKDGSPHVVPVWYEIDGETLVFTTWHASVKALNMRRDPRVCICIDDETPPFNYVRIEGRAEMSSDAEELKNWATRIGGKYMGNDQAEKYGKRNADEGELVVRISITKMTGIKDVAA